MFGKDQKYDRKTFKNESPKFSVSYPKHFNVNEPKETEVLRLRCPMSSTPLLTVAVDDKPSNIGLDDIWEEYLFNKFGKFGTDIELINEKQVELTSGIPGREFRFDWFSNGYWKVKTIILATYYQDNLIITTSTAFAHPEFFNEFLYSLSFE